MPEPPTTLSFTPEARSLRSAPLKRAPMSRTKNLGIWAITGGMIGVSLIAPLVWTVVNSDSPDDQTSAVSADDSSDSASNDDPYETPLDDAGLTPNEIALAQEHCSTQLFGSSFDQGAPDLAAEPTITIRRALGGIVTLISQPDRIENLCKQIVIAYDNG